LLENKFTLQAEKELKPRKISYFFVTINASLLKGLKGRAIANEPWRTAPAPSHPAQSAEQQATSRWGRNIRQRGDDTRHPDSQWATALQERQRAIFKLRLLQIQTTHVVLIHCIWKEASYTVSEVNSKKCFWFLDPVT